jgi:hypothetical protein
MSTAVIGLLVNLNTIIIIEELAKADGKGE